MKIMLTPFVRETGLSARLVWRSDLQDGRSRTDGYRGFKLQDRILKPDGQTTKLSQFLTAHDQIYINAHGAAGLDYVANNEHPEKGTKLEIDDLIQQLKDHGLPLQSQAKIKLWVCQGAMRGKAGQRSFAEHFSEKLHGAGYSQCTVYAYHECVQANFGRKKGRDGKQIPGWHKGVKGSDLRAREFREIFHNGASRGMG